MEIDGIHEKLKREEYEISFHAEKERYAEDITIHDLEAAIFSGEILEEYTDDPRGPSCLILGYSKTKPIHIVCGYDPAKWAKIITVYVPKRPKWIDARTRQKGGKKDA
jgi:hypothetical protein